MVFIDVFLDDDDGYYSALFTPDGKYIAASNCAMVVISDGCMGMVILDGCMGRLIRRVKVHTEWVNDIAFTPDGRGLMSGSP